MNTTRLLSAGFASAALALTFIAIAHAQPVEPPLIAEEKNHHYDPGPQLDQTWYETEGDWQGVWTPTRRGARNGAYNAVWHIGRQLEHATLQIDMPSPLAVQIVRTQADGQTCTYRGFFNTAVTVVTGTFTCDWSRRPMPWRASIGSRIAPSQAGDAPRATVVIDYLGSDWVETEGDWHGRWTQINPGTSDGYYNARWTKGNDHATATLEMSVDRTANRITVHRRDPDGRQCTYTGTISPNTLRSVTGQYRCSGQENFLPWRATMAP